MGAKPLIRVDAPPEVGIAEPTGVDVRAESLKPPDDDDDVRVAVADPTALPLEAEHAIVRAESRNPVVGSVLHAEIASAYELSNGTLSRLADIAADAGLAEVQVRVSEYSEREA